MLLAGLGGSWGAHAQVGVGTTTPDASAALHVSSPNKGVLFPQVSLASLTDAAAVPSPAPSLLVYNTNASLSGGVGFYYNAGTSAAPQWTRLNTGAAPAGSGWSLAGNAATDPATHYVGTTDRQPLVLRTEGQERARLGLNGAWWLGYPVTSGPLATTGNVLVGYRAGNALTPSAGSVNTTAQGIANLFVGAEAGRATTVGLANSFVGARAGESNVGGSYNLFAGAEAGSNNTSGNNNQFVGYQAGRANVGGTGNLFIGHQAGYASQNGSRNLFVGYEAGRSTTAAPFDLNPVVNHFVGYQAGQANVVGRSNQFEGYQAGLLNQSGDNNYFSGQEAGGSNVSGDNNHFAGYRAGISNTASNNHFVGYQAGFSNTTGTQNTATGYNAGLLSTIGSRNTFLGYSAGAKLRGADNVTLGNEAGAGPATGTAAVSADQVTLVGSQAGQNNAADGTVAVGYQAGQNNTTGLGNHFVGYQAGQANTTGNENYASGYRAGLRLSTGSRNVLVGNLAANDLTTGIFNSTLGYNAGATLVSGSRNTLLGYDTDVSSAGLSYATAIGVGATAGASNVMALGGTTAANQVRVGIGTATPASRLSITPTATEPKITLWDNGAAANHYGFGVSGFQLNYHVPGTSDNHVFYAGGRNGDGTELLRITGQGEVTRPATGAANLLPVAYGRVVGSTISTFPGAFGSIDTNTGEVDMQFVGAPLAGADLSGATVIVTCITSGRVAVARGTSSGHILVNVSNPSTNTGAGGDFQFVVYRP